MNESVARIAGWSAIVNGAFSIAVLVTLAAYFTLGGFWGRLNDTISIFWALTFIPVLVGLYQLHRADHGTLSLLLALVGIAAMLGFAFLQALLVAGQVTFEQTFLAVVALGGALGLVLGIMGWQARTGQALPSGLAWLMIAFGLGYVLSMVGFWLGGWENPLAGLGYLIGALTGPAWAFWLGKLLLNGRLITVAAAATSGQV